MVNVSKSVSQWSVGQSSIKSYFFLRHLPDFKQRIAGQSLPFEDFAIHKANKYFEQNGRLFLPGVVSDYIRLTFTQHSQDTLTCVAAKIKLVSYHLILKTGASVHMEWL